MESLTFTLQWYGGFLGQINSTNRIPNEALRTCGPITRCGYRFLARCVFRKPLPPMEILGECPSDEQKVKRKSKNRGKPFSFCDSEVQHPHEKRSSKNTEEEGMFTVFQGKVLCALATLQGAAAYAAGIRSMPI